MAPAAEMGIMVECGSGPLANVPMQGGLLSTCSPGPQHGGAAPRPSVSLGQAGQQLETPPCFIMPHRCWASWAPWTPTRIRSTRPPSLVRVFPQPSALSPQPSGLPLWCAASLKVLKRTKSIQFNGLGCLSFDNTWSTLPVEFGEGRTAGELKSFMTQVVSSWMILPSTLLWSSLRPRSAAAIDGPCAHCCYKGMSDCCTRLLEGPPPPLMAVWLFHRPVLGHLHRHQRLKREAWEP